MSTEIQWGWDGEEYRKHSSSQETRALTALKALQLKPGMTVLDIGCGDGKITHKIAQVVSPSHVFGVDKDPSMITTAQKSFSETPHLKFIEADIRQFKGEKVDVITSFFCLQWIPEEELDAVLKSIHDHLKDGGEICLMFAAYDFPHEIIKGMANSEKWKDHFNGFKDQQTFLEEKRYQDFLNNAGFQQSKVETISSTHFLTPREFVEFTRQWCGCYNHIHSPQLREAFIQDILIRLDTEQKNAEGKFMMVQKSTLLTAHHPTLTPAISHCF